MVAKLPYQGFSWQITQHAGCVEESLLRGLLMAAVAFDGQEVTNDAIDVVIAQQGILNPTTGRSLWRDYQQVLYELGLVYPTSLTARKIRVSGVAKEYLGGHLSFCELLTLQLLQYQYPNGYKTTISSEIAACIVEKGESYQSLIDLQEHYAVMIKPMVFVWRVLHTLYKIDPTSSFLSIAELQQIVLRYSSMAGEKDCVDAVAAARNNGVIDTAASSSVKRNASDWACLWGRTMLFDYEGKKLSLSKVSTESLEELEWLLDNLADDSSFWIGSSQDSETWFDYFGDINHPIRALITSHEHDLYHVFPSVVMGDVIAKDKFKLQKGV